MESISTRLDNLAEATKGLMAPESQSVLYSYYVRVFISPL
jgi:hypothetical protein